MSEEIQGWRDIIQQNGKIIQPQLTISKSVADKLDDIFNEFVREQDSRSIWELLWRADEVDLKIGEQLDELLPDENQVNIGIAYLAGKAIGVDLVKVVEMKNTTMYYENYDDDIKCETCGNLIDCDCMQCHECDDTLTCETCGLCHIDGWEAQDCWASENDPDYDPFDI